MGGSCCGGKIVGTVDWKMVMSGEAGISVAFLVTALLCRI